MGDARRRRGRLNGLNAGRGRRPYLRRWMPSTGHAAAACPGEVSLLRHWPPTHAATMCVYSRVDPPDLGVSGRRPPRLGRVTRSPISWPSGLTLKERTRIPARAGRGRPSQAMRHAMAPRGMRMRALSGPLEPGRVRGGPAGAAPDRDLTWPPRGARPALARHGRHGRHGGAPRGRSCIRALSTAGTPGHAEEGRLILAGDTPRAANPRAEDEEDLAGGHDVNAERRGRSFGVVLFLAFCMGGARTARRGLKLRRSDQGGLMA